MDPEAFEQQLAVAMVDIAEKRAAQAARETKKGNRTEKAGTLARGMRPVLNKEVHPTRRGFVAGRDLVRNVVELDTYARALHSAVMSTACRSPSCVT